MKKYLEKIQALPEFQRRTILGILMALIILAVLFFGARKTKQRFENLGEKKFLEVTPATSSFLKTISLEKKVLEENFKEFKEIIEIYVPK